MRRELCSQLPWLRAKTEPKSSSKDPYTVTTRHSALPRITSPSGIRSANCIILFIHAVYDLPEELLATLSTKADTAQTPAAGLLAAGQEAEQSQSVEAEDEDNGISTGTNCSVCQVSFLSVDDQREHVRSDHHRYNVKARLRGNRTLDEAEFNKAIGELDESISGSESESEEAEGEGENQTAPDVTLASLLKRQAKLSSSSASSSPDASQVVTGKKVGAGREPLLWFTSSSLEKNTFLGIYRALFTDVEQNEPDHLVDTLRNKQAHRRVRNSSNKGSATNAGKDDPHVFLCMIGGGHFAAMVAALPPEVHKKAGGIEDRQARVLAHKTFHRYTTRRKQGGSQSAMDSAKGAASSAGSSIRRYNEAALEKEVRQLLQDWKDMIDDSQFLYVKAAGVTNRRILFGAHEGQVLRQSDPRLRGFPFSTRRPTQAELMRAFTELTRVKVRRIDEAELAKEAEKQRQAATTSPKPSPKPQKPKISKEEETALLHTSQIQALIRRSKVPALLSYLSNNSVPPSFTFHPPTSPQNHRSPTPLHLAASSNSPAVVLALLTKAQSDPTSLNDEGKPPFDLTNDRPTRDAFRVARHDLGEASWDWDAAHVPSAVSKAETDSRAESEKKEAETAEAQRRKDEVERLRKEEEEAKATTEKKKSSSRTLAAAEKSFAEKREEETRGMNPEIRARLERERRARAAEERIRRMQAGPQS